MKTIAATAFALVLSTSFVLAQLSQARGEARTGWTSGTAYTEKSEVNSGLRNSENFGVRDSEMTEPGDFAVTGGVSDRGNTGNPTGQVDPGTSNSPAGNAGGE
jgi:hypothetical protein